MAEEVKRTRGRPANFPGVETTPRLYNLPNTTLALVEAEAARRGDGDKNEAIGITIDRLIRAGFKEVNRKR